jgi:hypothetical protein
MNRVKRSCGQNGFFTGKMIRELNSIYLFFFFFSPITKRGRLTHQRNLAGE